MNDKSVRGIALILFGMLLCMGSGEINRSILYGVSDFPFAAVGVICGIVGLVIIFLKNESDTDK